MRIYWYWPYAKAEDLAVPDAIPRAGDALVLHTLPGQVPDPSVAPRIEVRQTLTPPSDEREHSLRWAFDRSTAYLRRAQARARTLRDEHFDVCHVVFLNYFTDGLDLRRLARRSALVYEVHDVVPHHSRLPRVLERMLLSLQYGAPGQIVVRHGYLRDRLVHEFGVDPARVAIVPHYVVDVGAPARTTIADRPRVLFFGTLRRNKGVDVLLEAIALLRDRDDVEFVVAGRGFPDVEDAVRAAAARDRRIAFEPGYVTPERKSRLYETADLVVLPYTEFASTSGVLCDAYTYRVPVVVTDAGALGASVRAEETGWVVRPRAASELAAAIAGALADPAAWARASRQAASTARLRTPERTAERLRDVYQSTQKTRSRGTR